MRVFIENEEYIQLYRVIDDECCNMSLAISCLNFPMRERGFQ